MKDEMDQMDLRMLLDKLEQGVLAYFVQAEATLKGIPRPDRWGRPDRDQFWKELPEQLRNESETLVRRLLELAGLIANAVNRAPWRQRRTSEMS
jgi:hypothetical protein